ncbi:fray2 [Scenedesmus sp. PABB004]|nr:fray2 [Scenedesmus sp. PABB004]
MRQSKSLGSLASWHKQRTGSKGQLLDADDGRTWPTSLDAYELLEDCGRGVSAVVYRARVRASGEVVAIKALNLEALQSPLEDIMHEAQTMKARAACARGAARRRGAAAAAAAGAAAGAGTAGARWRQTRRPAQAYKHEAILPLYCSFVSGSELFMVMPYMQGGSVAHIMRYAHPDGLSEPVIATIMREVLRALAYVHAHGGIHRDIKAGNILVDGEGRVKLGDFGVATTLEREGDWGVSTKSRLTFVGTPCWMAPEVLEQTSGYRSSADIWSFGITMLEAAHGHAPFSRLPPMKVLLLTLQGPPPQLEASCGGRHFSRGMREVVARCLNKDPAKRPSAKDLLEHRFFKQARDAEFLKRTLLAGLPPLPQRVVDIRAGKAATLALDNDRDAMASHISYITDVAQWDFNCTKGALPGLDAPAPGGGGGAAAAGGSAGDGQPASGRDQAGGAGARDVAHSQAAEDATAARPGQVQQQPGVVIAHAGLQQQHAPDAQQQEQQQQQQQAPPVLAGDAGPGAKDAAAAGAGAGAAAAPAAICFAGGKQVAAFALASSGPSTPDRSPLGSRPATPEAAAGAGAARSPGRGAAPPGRPGTAGGELSAKRHGRFTIVEAPYLEAGSPSVARQRSVSSPDMGGLAALRLELGGGGDDAGDGGGGAAGARPAAPRVSAPGGSGAPAAPAAAAGAVAAPAVTQPQQQQQQQQLQQQRHPPPPSAFAQEHVQAAASRAGFGGASSSGSLASGSLARPGGSLSDIYGAPAAAGGPQRSASPGWAREHHTAAQVWDHLKGVCAEAVDKVAQPFKHHHHHAQHGIVGGGGSRGASPQPAPQPATPPAAPSLAAGPASPRADSALSLASGGSAAAALPSFGSSGSSTSRPPRYQPAAPGSARREGQPLSPTRAPSGSGAPLAAPPATGGAAGDAAAACPGEPGRTLAPEPSFSSQLSAQPPPAEASGSAAAGGPPAAGDAPASPPRLEGISVVLQSPEQKAAAAAATAAEGSPVVSRRHRGRFTITET